MPQAKVVEEDKERILKTSADKRLLDDPSDSQDDENECWDDAKEEQYSDTTKAELSNHHQYDYDKSLRKASQPSSSGKSGFKPASTSSDPLAIELKSLALHVAVFNNDANKVRGILSCSELCKQLINKKDKHGNTPLHLACMMGRSKEMVTDLLQAGAVVDLKNVNRWTPFHEACSYGDREIITLMTTRLQEYIHDTLNKNKLSEKLATTKNYRMVLKWEFQSWVPFLTRVLPSDVCVINKQGRFVRIDTRLLDLEAFPWRRGDSCLIYSTKFEKKWIVLNNKTKKYQHFEPQHIDKDIEDKVDDIMSNDIIDFDLKSADIQLTRSTCGWIWKADRIEKVGRFNAALYNFNNVYLMTRKRREHLTSDDLKRNKLTYKAAVHVLKFGQKPSPKDLNGAQSCEANDEMEDDNSDYRYSEDGQEDGNSEPTHRESLPPPPPTKVAWNEYYKSEPGCFPTLGREQNCKVVKRAFKASVAMSEEFPIMKNEFLDLLSIVPLKHFKKLKEFIEGRLPDGFPVRVDVPIFPFLTARITFEDFTFIDEPIDESLFTIPEDYEEDLNLLHRLTGKLKNSNSN